MLHCLEAPEHERARDPELVKRLARRSTSSSIRCPRCRWKHDGKKYWGCELCGAVFDTFVTVATCPSCPQSWTFTQCPKCDALSLHDDWYAREPEPKPR